ncbi:MAG: ribonuclease HIII [Planctomycetota bacterium]|jgi:ribonuclease HIII
MAQETRVATVTPREAALLEERLLLELPSEAEWRTVPHARFSVKALGVVVTCYHSGKLVLQGQGLATFQNRFLATLAGPISVTSTTPDPSIGSDEAGKGDYFGPLVVAAVHADPEQVRWLRKANVADSKNVSDNRAHTVAAQIEGRLDCRVVSLMPEQYNERHGEVGNLNVLLAALHAEVLAPLIHTHGADALVMVDKFAADELVQKAVADRGVHPTRLVCETKAERYPVVAAASLLARSVFLQGLAECTDISGTDLHKGAGAPVDKAGRRVLEIGGRELLAKVAKLHFRNTGKISR